MDLTVKHERFGSSMKVTNGTLCVRLANRDRPIEQEAREKIAKHRNLYNLLPGDIGFLPLVVSTSGRLNADFIRLTPSLQHAFHRTDSRTAQICGGDDLFCHPKIKI